MSQVPSLLQKANLLIDQGQHAQAEAVLKRVIASDSRGAAGYAMMAHVLLSQERFVQAEFFAKGAAERAPNDPGVLHNFGYTLFKVGKYAAAEGPLTRAVDLNPGMMGTRAVLGLVLIGLNKYASAARVLRPGVEAGDLDMANSYTHALHCMGRVEEAIGLMRDVAGASPGHVGRAQHLASMSNYAPGLSALDVFEAHKVFGQAMAASVGAATVWTATRAPDMRPAGTPLRVGLISPDLRDHAVGYLIEAFPEFADRSKVFIAAYSSATHEDARSVVLKKKMDLWRPLHGVSTSDAAAIIRNDNIHVLIDLAGHTSGHRLDVLALKPAPVQMTYMGYPNCTGLTAVDYRVVDTLSEPEGMEPFSVEKLLRMDPCFLSYRAPDPLPPVSDLPLARQGAAPVFCAFSTLIKFNTPLFNLWARVLTELPGSTMILKHFGLREEEVRQDVKARFGAAGVDPSRIITEPPSPTSREILPQYARADICLDSFPYNGTTTICEAALMGVPVVSLSGETPASRVSRSLLAAIGTPELCAATEDEYVRIAVGLARDIERLKVLRANLRGMFLKSPIGDGPRFSRRFTAMAEAAWEGWAQGRPVDKVVETPSPQGT